MNRRNGFPQDFLALSLGGALLFFAVSGGRAEGNGDGGAAALAGPADSVNAPLRADISLVGLERHAPAIRLGLSMDDEAGPTLN